MRRGGTIGPSDRARAQPGEIVVNDAQVKQFAEQFAAVWRRQPTQAEMEKLIDEFIREEDFVREAFARSLDRDDAVIRRRLSEKMQFLIESSASALQPSDEDLRTFYQANADRFRTAPKIAFEQVFLGQDADTGRAAEVRDQLTAGADPASVGVRTRGRVSVSFS